MNVDLSNAEWWKARKSGGGGCVEVAVLADAVAVRDSKDPAGPKLIFTPYEWACFFDGAAKGEFEPQ